MTRILNHLKGNVVGYVALFIALGGTSYAAVRLPAGSVGAKQLKNGAVGYKQLAKQGVGTRALKNHAITPQKLGTGSIAGYMRAYAQIGGDGTILSSRPRAKVIAWRPTGPYPGGLIQWKQPVSSSCFVLATTTGLSGTVSYASAQLAPGAARVGAATSVLLSVAGQPVNVAIMCPQP
jgi:hypothetical protein